MSMSKKSFIFCMMGVFLIGNVACSKKAFVSISLERIQNTFTKGTETFSRLSASSKEKIQNWAQRVKSTRFAKRIGEWCNKFTDISLQDMLYATCALALTGQTYAFILLFIGCSFTPLLPLAWTASAVFVVSMIPYCLSMFSAVKRIEKEKELALLR